MSSLVSRPSAFCCSPMTSPPLPPPAEVTPFGGLGGFGLGDLGFDPGALGNVLLPSLVKKWFPNRTGLLVGAYSAALSLGGAFSIASSRARSTARRCVRR